MTEPSSPPPHGLRRIRLLTRSLAVKLFFWIFAGMVAVFAVFGYLSYESTSEQWMQSVRQSAHRTSLLIERAIHDGMLLNEKEDVHNTIRSINKSPGVAGIRIYDKTGTIMFSAREDEIGRQVDLKAEACVICHKQDQPLHSVPQGSRVRVFRDVHGDQVLGLINPIKNAPECSNAACHAHPAGKSVLGVLDVKMGISYIDEAQERARTDTILVVLLMALAGGIAVALLIYRMIRVPVKRLTSGIRRVSAGELGTQIELLSKDEMGELATAFNRMSDGLASAQQKEREWAEELERKVVEKSEEIGRMLQQIAQVDKMASLGKLAATVAHELNNPLAGILVYAKLVQRLLKPVDEVPDNIWQHLSLIESETARCGEIVKNLLLFARESKVNVARRHINDIIERCLRLIQHQLELSEIELDAQLMEGDDELLCDAGKIQQALIVILVNAIESMSDGGQLTVRATGDEDEILISVSDSGVGIPPDVRPHIFEPFFSTKDASKGVGLGLAVAYGIVHRHGGRIEATSEQGEGTTFTVTLPRYPTTQHELEATEPEDPTTQGETV